MTLYRKLVLEEGDPEPDLTDKDFWQTGVWNDIDDEYVSVMFVEVEATDRIRWCIAHKSEAHTDTYPAADYCQAAYYSDERDDCLVRNRYVVRTEDTE